MKTFLISVLLLFSFGFVQADTSSSTKNATLEKYFDEITYVDVFIDPDHKLNHPSAKLLIESGNLATPFLVKKIFNTTRSNVKSIGLLREPKKGELALVLLMKIHKIPAEQWPFPPGYDAGKSAVFTPSNLKGGPLLVSEYFRTKDGPKKLRDIWQIYAKNNS